ncbi:MAG: 1,4-beta-xylanase, partial [Planctomycetes bacterium]|nr:1,4-beta-xylanase [Planctomycetota bacterium]
GKLRVRASVRDDRHRQPHHGAGAWKGDGVQLALAIPGQGGFWEFGLSRHDDGQVEINVYSVPVGMRWTPADGGAALKVEGRGGRLEYEFAVDAASLGVTPAVAKSGFRFNLLVNDDDGEGRDGWIAIAPGIGDGKDPAKYPFVVFE